MKNSLTTKMFWMIEDIFDSLKIKFQWMRVKSQLKDQKDQNV
jgi:hypothetical protein